jgi:hypothetical protein
MLMPSLLVALSSCHSILAGNGVAAGPPSFGEPRRIEREGAQYGFAFFRFVRGRIHEL